MLDVERIEQKIGYTFSDKRLLETAFTHVSFAKANGCADNERLEYLGDAVLELLITERQYFDSVSTEGVMTKTRQGLVSKQPLKEAIQRMDVVQYLRFLGGKDNVGDKTVSSLYESLLAAIYLDGGIEAARAFVQRHPLVKTVRSSFNFKGDLQEYLQKRGQPLPVYHFQKQGPDNAPTFLCEVVANGERGQGNGATKREAEQLAARQLLEQLSDENRGNKTKE